MTEYRLQRMRVGGDIGHVLMVSHVNDGAALTHALDFGRGRAVEVWSGERRLATVLPGTGRRMFSKPA